MNQLSQQQKKQLLNIYREQGKIYAVKYVKDNTSYDLIESKKVVEEIIETYNNLDIFDYLVNLDVEFSYKRGIIIVNSQYKTNIVLIRDFCDIAGFKVNNIGEGLIYITL